MNWLQRLIYDYRNISFSVSKDQHNKTSRLIHAINYYQSKEDDGSDYYEEVDHNMVYRAFIVLGIEQTLGNFTTFAKAFAMNESKTSLTPSRGIVVQKTILQAKEIQVLDDISMSLTEFLSEAGHYTIPQLNRDALIRYYIYLGAEQLQSIPVSRATQIIKAQ